MTRHQAADSTPTTTGATATSATATGPMVAVTDLRRSFGTGERTVHALRGISFSVGRGELTALKGRSGSGKTTLLNLVGGLDAPTGGSIALDGIDLGGLNEDGRLALRRERIGFVFQSFGLIPMLTAAENVGVPMRLRKVLPAEREERAHTLLALVGLADHANQRPGELSGGQQQRVAIARALISKPSVIFADEPTGNLDSVSSAEVLTLMRDLVKELGQTIVMVTHDATAASYTDRAIILADGQIVADREHPQAQEMSDLLTSIMQEIVGKQASAHHLAAHSVHSLNASQA